MAPQIYCVHHQMMMMMYLKLFTGCIGTASPLNLLVQNKATKRKSKHYIHESNEIDALTIKMKSQ